MYTDCVYLSTIAVKSGSRPCANHVEMCFGAPCQLDRPGRLQLNVNHIMISQLQYPSITFPLKGSLVLRSISHSHGCVFHMFRSLTPTPYSSFSRRLHRLSTLYALLDLISWLMYVSE
jgi:hypothetical protein